MSSSPPAERRTARFSPRAWSLRVRLLVTLVALLTVVCAGIGVATEFALQRFLMSQLDEQVVDAANRSAMFVEFGPPPPPRHPPEVQNGPPPPPPQAGQPSPIHAADGRGPEFLNTPGQPTATVGAVVAGGDSLSAGIITASGARAEISAAAAQQLAGVPADGRPRTVDLDGLGRYRLVALDPGHLRLTVVTGLPTADVDDTLLRAFVIFCVVAAVALVVAAAAGVVIVRRQLAPLARVAVAAQQVADLELDRGEVRLPTPIVKVDPIATNTDRGLLDGALIRMLVRIAGALSARHASETGVRQFVADASHELRTPLAAIHGYTELAQRQHDELPAEVAHAMDRVESETKRMTQLVEDLLLLARLDNGRPLQRDPVDLTRLVVDAVSDAHVAGPDHTWQLDLPDEPVIVPGDEARLHQVLANLLANARTHTPPGSAVVTSLSAGDSAEVVLRVTDDGPGIPEWLQPEVFERFARADTSRSRRGGSTGLGLAIVDAVVRAHGGSITVESEPGRTEFAVTLPGTAQPPHSGGQSET